MFGEVCSVLLVCSIQILGWRGVFEAIFYTLDGDQSVKPILSSRQHERAAAGLIELSREGSCCCCSRVGRQGWEGQGDSALGRRGSEGTHHNVQIEPYPWLGETMGVVWCAMEQNSSRVGGSARAWTTQAARAITQAHTCGLHDVLTGTTPFLFGRAGSTTQHLCSSDNDQSKVFLYTLQSTCTKYVWCQN